MTNLEALKAKVAGYPLDDNTFEVALLDRGLDSKGDYTGVSREFELAQADVYVVLLTVVNVTEGGYQISMTEKSNFKSYASGIYSKWNVPNPLSDKDVTPIVKNVNPW